MHGKVACLVDSKGFPFIIAREYCAGIMFCTRDEFVGISDGCESKEYYYFLSEGDENHIRGLIVAKRCRISEEAYELFKNTYGFEFSLKEGHPIYKEMKPYLKYFDVDILVNF